MNKIVDPIFKKQLPKISWKKIYDREYGVQYSGLAVSLFDYAAYHFPKTSVTQVVVPGEGSNTSFYIDAASWIQLVEGLNKKYTSNVKNLEKYEKQFFLDGKNYLRTAKKIARLNLKKLNNKELLSIFLNHQDKRFRYSCFAWSAFILNNYVADRATAILETYIKKAKIENDKQEIIDSLFRPEKRAAILELQYQVEKHNGELTKKQFDNLYEQFKWLACLDIHNKPWTKEEFKAQVKSFTKSSKKNQISFETIKKELKFSKKDLDYLLMAKRFVYIKDARDDFRRESVFYASNLYKELARRMGIEPEEVSYLQEEEIIEFLSGKNSIDKKIIYERKKGFILYLDYKKRLVCLQGDLLQKVLTMFGLSTQKEEGKELTGSVASQGMVKGKVVIVKGIKDLNKVNPGDILVAVTTHPDYVAAMRRAVAIVTDEGGITSHAAIVAREFGIPCIVGTQHATAMFADGDIIEVDAMKGMVRRI